MIKFRILSEVKGRVEFDFLYVWEDKYECVDARYVNIVSSRDTALYNFKVYIYKLMYLNPERTEDDFVFCGLELIRNTMSTKGTYLLDSDVYRIVGDIFNSKDFDSDLYERVKEFKRIEWKQNISNLFLGLNKEDNDYSEKVKNIKIKESLRCINSLKMDKNRKLILNSIISIKEEHDGKCSISDLARFTGMSYNSVKRYYEEYMDEFMLDEYYFVENKNETLKDEKILLMKQAIDRLKAIKVKITKVSVSQYSGVSRNTVNKRWEELNNYING